MPFERRQAQTRIKHDILRGYGGAWAGIITQGVLRRRPASDHVVDLAYFDGFAGFGSFQGDADQPHCTDPVWGSPIIGLQTLEAVSANLAGRLNVRVTGILVEEDSEKFDELLDNLRAAQLATRIVQVNHLRCIEPGVVNVLSSDVREHVGPLVGALDDEMFLFTLVDPWGTSMPMALLKQLIARPRTDAITLFPVAQVHRYAGSARKARATQTAGDRDNIQRNTIHMGSEEWLEIANQDISCDEAAERYVELYRKQLLTAATGLVVKNIGLSFANRSEASGPPGYHLFLTTRHVHGAFRMNDIIRNAEINRHLMHWQDHERQAAFVHESAGIYELSLDVPHVHPPAVREPPRISVDEAKALVLEHVPPGTHTLRQILQRLANSVLKETEVKAGLKALKHEGHADYQNLSGDNSRIDVMLPTP